MFSVRNAVRFSLIIVFNLDAFVLTVGLCSVFFVFEHVMLSNWQLAEQFENNVQCEKCVMFPSNHSF